MVCAALSVINNLISKRSCNLFACRDVSQLHEEQRKLIRKSGGAAIGFYPDDGSGQKGNDNMTLGNNFETSKLLYYLYNKVIISNIQRFSESKTWIWCL